MATILYAELDGIRSVLGVSSKEMSDEQLSTRMLEQELRLDLANWVGNHVTLADAVNSGIATTTEIDTFDALGLYSTYFCAKLIVTSLQLAAIQSVSDGKNAMNRFTTIDYEQLYSRLSERVSFYKKFVTDNNSVTTTAATVAFKPFSIVGSSYDPVTG